MRRQVKKWLARRRRRRRRFWFVRPRVVYRHQWLGHHQIRPEYVVSSKAIDIAYIDRTSTLDFGFPYAVREPLPDFTQPMSSSFNELVDLRAAELIDSALSFDGPITVFWSGGIDSTLVLAAFLEELKKLPANRRPALRVLLSKRSIDEYPWFFENVIRPQCQHSLLSALVSYQVRDGIAVTGELGDQIFGLLVSILDEDGSAFELLAQPYQPFLREILVSAYQWLAADRKRDDIVRRLGRDEQVVASCVSDYLFPQLQKCPFPIKTVHDFLWWVQISLKWQAKALQDVHPFATHYDESRIKHFFETTEFQLWSFQNRHHVIRESWNSYKWQAKSYIAKVTGDTDYELTKTKHNSKQHVTRDIEPIFRARSCYKALLDDGRVIRRLSRL